MGNVLVIAPHPDDETLGCGGTILRHVAAGDQVHWLIITRIGVEHGFSPEVVAKRSSEIDSVSRAYGFSQTHISGFPTAKLDTLSTSDLVQAISGVMATIQPETIYLPYRNDVHSDHAIVFDAAISSSKNFRYPSVRKLYAYETLSETEFGLRPDDPGFRPNLFVDITDWLDRKIAIMQLYEGEMADFPFPRSEECIRSLATLRGSRAGVRAAEAFVILQEIR